MTLQGGKRKVTSVGNYRFTGKLLGKGNFARVEEAFHNVLNVKVAIKIMDVNQIKEEYVIRNLCREARVMSKLNHPCIVSLFQTMQRSDNIYYLITELVSGGDLCSFIKGQRNGKLEERATRVYARQFTSALSHMHSMGIVHRDLKMENVMLNSIQTQIKIVDFGLSNVWTSDNPLRTHCGSPEYAAPELFVTGKEYGAEVDLWSLGIILYGMVVGQLPFVSSRSDHVSSQERRKRLVAQINKGMASPQRRAIATLSAEFRNMMNKLLVADSTKRITIKELIIHPWITDKGKKLIRTNPIKKPDDKTKLRIIREVATLLNVDSKEVIASIEREPFGKLGGMYNILIHKYTMNQLKGDGVSKNVMPINLDIERPCSRREYIFQQINSERLPKQTLSSITRNPHVPRVVLVERSPRPNTVDIPTSQHVKVKTPTSRYVNNEKCSDRSRPKTVHTQKFQEFEDYRMLKSPTHRRKAYSAALANRQVSTDDIHKNVVLGNQDENVQIVKQKTILTPRKVVRDDLSNSRKCTNQSPSTKAGNSASLRQTMANRAQSAVTRQQESKSDHNTKKGQTVRLVKRIIKQSGVSPVMETRSASRSQSASTKPTSTSRKTAAIQGQVNLEKSPFGHGDGLLRPHSPGVGLASQNKHPYIYDPIARSIAGYVVNNVPDKFRKFSWLRK